MKPIFTLCVNVSRSKIPVLFFMLSIRNIRHKKTPTSVVNAPITSYLSGFFLSAKTPDKRGKNKTPPYIA